jgi:hypothetical protein
VRRGGPSGGVRGGGREAEEPGRPEVAPAASLDSPRQIGAAAHAAFAADDRTPDDVKTLDHAMRIMVALRIQAPFNGEIRYRKAQGSGRPGCEVLDAK